MEVFQVFVTKSRGFSSFEEKKTVFQVFVTKSGGFWRKKNTQSGGLEVYSEQNPPFWEESAWQSQVHDSKE